MILYFTFNFFFILILLVMVLVSVAFLTLLERKILGYIQDRKGPNKVGMMGMLQPFSDAVKLFSKEIFLMKKINFFFYYMSSLMVLFVSLMLWLLIPFFTNLHSMENGLMYMLMLFSLGVYPLMYGGWSSNSSYALLGSIRSVAQSISYEVSLFLILFSLIIMVESFSMMEVMKIQKYFIFVMFMFPIYLLFLISLLIELNRTPFDLVEGESELVSGFNTEYFSSMFALIFMGEYSSIIFSSYLVTMLFFNSYSMIFNVIFLIHVFFIIWIRGVLPRMRYDKLMYLCWKIFLSIVLMYIIVFYSLKDFIMFIEM